MSEAIAHVRTEATGEKIIQSLTNHLRNVAAVAAEFAAKIGLPQVGELLGLLHDIGKGSEVFGNYISTAEGLQDPDSDDYPETTGQRGKIDHSTAGAQYVYNKLADKGPDAALVSEMLAFCLVSHHSGLINGLAPDGVDSFGERIRKSDEKTHQHEAIVKLDPEIKNRIDAIIDDPAFIPTVRQAISAIRKKEPSQQLQKFQDGMLLKFLFSCLLDADRLDSADFANPETAKRRQNSVYIDWKILIDRLDSALAKMPERNEVDTIRRQVSATCRAAAENDRGIFTLEVPTGGGKTLASLRFALHHAWKHDLDRIIYVIPYTSIIDQNAATVRRILETAPEDRSRIVLEHHSNLMPEEDSWHRKILAENWDAPIIFTTSVQFLETLFAPGTRSMRRLHQLAKAVLIFDEIQTLPIRTVHLFNNSLNFLVETAGSTAIMCTATQPLLQSVARDKGALRLPPQWAKIIPPELDLFSRLKRVEVINKTRPGGWSCREIASLANGELPSSGSVLIVANTKKVAREIFRHLSELKPGNTVLCHLSTAMCPAHRREVLEKIQKCLDPQSAQPILCVTTQLIEAGVDVDFGCVIRCVAGLDSVAQAAGRCNRNGLRSQLGSVYIVNPSQENLSKLPDIRIGQEKTKRVFNDFCADRQRFAHDLIGPPTIEQFYRYYFWERAPEMTYLIKPGSVINRDDSLLNLLSGNGTQNSGTIGEYVQTHDNTMPLRFFRQSFMAAAKAFAVIDSPTQGILVPWGGGADIITALCASPSPETEYKLLHEAQQYSVNVFPDKFRSLMERKEMVPIGDSGVIALRDLSLYSDAFGLSDKAENRLSTLIK